MLTTCQRCGGCGQVEVTGVYAETLALLRESGETYAVALAKLCKCKCKFTSMNQRLKALEVMGLAESRKFGRKRLFKAT